MKDKLFSIVSHDLKDSISSIKAFLDLLKEDSISKEHFFSALNKIFHMSKESRIEMGKKGRDHVIKNYGFEKYNEQWVNLMDETIEQEGSWETRKNYSGIRFGVVA